VNGNILVRRLGVDRFSGLYLWVMFFVVFAVWTPNLFLTSVTLHSVVHAQVVAAMLGLAVMIPLAANTFDLSVGATIGLSAVVVCWLQNNHGYSVGSAMAVAVAVCIVIGAVNGFVVVVLKVNSFIATLGMASILAAVLAIVSDQSQPLPPTSKAWMNLTQHEVGGFQVIVLYLLVLAAVVWWVMAKTPAGRYLYAIGGNADAARLSGVSVGKWTWISLIASAGISGAAGVLYASQNGPSLTFGTALLLPAFSAAFLGSTQFTPGRVNVWGTVLAVYVLATGVKGLQLVTGVQWLSEMFSGVALILAVAFAGWGNSRAVATEATDDPGGDAPRPASNQAEESPPRVASPVT